MEQYLFFEECDRARAPFPLVTLNTVGPTLMRYGSAEQKDRFLPQILRGEFDWLALKQMMQIGLLASAVMAIVGLIGFSRSDV